MAEKQAKTSKKTRSKKAAEESTEAKVEEQPAKKAPESKTLVTHAPKEQPKKKSIEECKDLVWHEAMMLAEGKKNSIADMMKVVRDFKKQS